MNTLVASTSRTATESILRRAARAFFAEVRRSLEFVGQAHSHGLPPL
jgi:hypothetical protein